MKFKFVFLYVFAVFLSNKCSPGEHTVRLLSKIVFEIFFPSSLFFPVCCSLYHSSR